MEKTNCSFDATPRGSMRGAHTTRIARRANEKFTETKFYEARGETYETCAHGAFSRWRGLGRDSGERENARVEKRGSMSSSREETKELAGVRHIVKERWRKK